MAKALVIVPDADLGDEVRRALGETGIDACVTDRSTKAPQLIAEASPDVIIVEMFLEDQSGFALCKTLREDPASESIPILMLTASAAEMDRILAFEAGADDVLPRPFYPRELALRVRALMRRAEQRQRPRAGLDERLEHGSLRIDLTRQRVFASDREVSLTDKELAILALLMRRPGRVFSRKEILERVWGESAHRTPRVVDTHMKGIRRKLGVGVPPIESLRGVGYRLADRANGEA